LKASIRKDSWLFSFINVSNMEKPEIKLPDELPTTPVSADPKPLPVPIKKPDTL
jgi:hypothetical protein